MQQNTQIKELKGFINENYMLYHANFTLHGFIHVKVKKSKKLKEKTKYKGLPSNPAAIAT